MNAGEHARWACTSGPTSNNYNPVAPRQKMKHVEMPQGTFRQHDQHRGRGRLRSEEQTRGRGAALPELRRADALRATNLCIECDACIDICPVGLPHDHEERQPRNRCCATQPDGAGCRQPRTRRCSCRSPLKQTKRVMVKDENVCLHCGLCAERCPTATPGTCSKFDDCRGRTPNRPRRRRRWPASPSRAKGLSSNGPRQRLRRSRSPPPTAPARPAPTALIMQAIFRMGISGHGQERTSRRTSRGCPPGTRLRVSKDGYTARTGRIST